MQMDYGQKAVELWETLQLVFHEIDSPKTITLLKEISNVVVSNLQLFSRFSIENITKLTVCLGIFMEGRREGVLYAKTKIDRTINVHENLRLAFQGIFIRHNFLEAASKLYTAKTTKSYKWTQNQKTMNIVHDLRKKITESNEQITRGDVCRAVSCIPTQSLWRNEISKEFPTLNVEGVCENIKIIEKLLHGLFRTAKPRTVIAMAIDMYCFENRIMFYKVKICEKCGINYSLLISFERSLKNEFFEYIQKNNRMEMDKLNAGNL